MIVVVHAPVFLPSSSIVFAASGIDEWTKPRALPSTRTFRAFAGLAGAVAGSAAIIFVTSSGQGVCPTVGRLPRPPQARLPLAAGTPPARPPPAAARRPAAPAPGRLPGARVQGRRRADRSVTDPLFAVSAASYHLSNALFISARVTEPSLSASSAVHKAALLPLPPRLPPRSRRGLRRLGLTPGGGQENRRRNGCRPALKSVVSLPQFLPATRAGVAVAVETSTFT